MTDLVLHIGAHKTGTSSIQRSLWINRDALGEERVMFFCADPFTDKYSGNISFGFDHSRIENGDVRIRLRLYEALDQCLKEKTSKADMVVISSECFFWLANEHSISQLAKRLFKRFENIRVILYLRRQDRHALSHYQQALRTDAERLFFEHKRYPLPVLNSRVFQYLDFYSKIRIWSTAFGKDRLSVFNYDEMVARGEDVVVHFFKQLGTKAPLETKRINQSFNGLQAELGFWLLRNNVNPLQHEWRQLINAIRSDYKLAPSRQEAIEFYDNFRKKNILLASAVSEPSTLEYFDTDFSEFPSHRNSVLSN